MATSLERLEYLIERCVKPCDVCEGEGEIADGLDEAACSMPCPRCDGNAWLVDLEALTAAQRDAGEVLSGLLAAAQRVDRLYGMDVDAFRQLRAAIAKAHGTTEAEALSALNTENSEMIALSNGRMG